jgi:hypothetical protein
VWLAPVALPFSESSAQLFSVVAYPDGTSEDGVNLRSCSSAVGSSEFVFDSLLEASFDSPEVGSESLSVGLDSPEGTLDSSEVGFTERGNRFQSID